MVKSKPLAVLRARGFDCSYWTGSAYRVKCSQCEALVVNGTATHEIGCPNAVHECVGCSSLIPLSARYCGDCSR